MKWLFFHSNTDLHHALASVATSHSTPLDPRLLLGSGSILGRFRKNQEANPQNMTEFLKMQRITR